MGDRTTHLARKVSAVLDGEDLDDVAVVATTILMYAIATSSSSLTEKWEKLENVPEIIAAELDDDNEESLNS
jgi:uncharacterized protein YmfQ (DUF2313 family)